MQIDPDLGLGFKGLLVVNGIYASQHDIHFVWDSSGFVESECHYISQYGHHKSYTFKECTCGIYAAYDQSTADAYRLSKGIASVLVLVQPYGETVYGSEPDGLGWRAERAQIVGVIAGLSAGKAADFWGVEQIPTNFAQILVDMLMSKMAVKHGFDYRFRELTPKIMKEYKNSIMLKI